MKPQDGLVSLTRVDLRDVFSDEAKDFTPWLAKQENLSLLGDAIGLKLQYEAQEKAVGPFSADILCRDTASGNLVVIENQLEKTDHSHLGQLLTYASGLNCVTVVWIAAEFTDQHRACLDWLNDHTKEGINFFGLEIELWRIGKSPTAPKFNLRCEPNDWSGAASQGKISELGQLQLRFWTAFKEYLEKNSQINCQNPLPQSYMNHSIGYSGIHLSSNITTWNSVSNSYNPEIRIQLYLTGKNAQQNFALLETKQNEIEHSIGAQLTWHNPAGNKECKIYVRRDADFLNEKLWPEQMNWMKDNLELFKKAFGSIVQKLEPQVNEEAST